MSVRPILALLVCAAAARAGVLGNVRGIVHDPDHRPVPGAEVNLHAANSDWHSSMSTSADGEFRFPAVPAGEYSVTVQTSGFASLEQNIQVTTNSAPVLHLQLQLAIATASVEAKEHAELIDPESSSFPVLVSRGDVDRTPGADRTNSLAMITNFVPGAYVTHDQLHIRGGHQVTWTVDGVPVPNTNIASNVGPQFDPKDIDYLEVQRGGYSAESGDRTYGVFNVVPRTGFERTREAELVTSYGSFHQTNDQLSFGDHTSKFAWYASANGNRTDLGLEPPSPQVLHDNASGLGGFGSLIYNADPANQLRLVGSVRRDDYDIPNDPDQQQAGIRDAERESDAFLNFSWVNVLPHGFLLTVSPFYHFNRAHYIGGPADSPLVADDNHASSYAGGQATLAMVTGRHNAKVGVYGFAQRDSTAFRLATSGASPLRQTERLGGDLEAVFLEDQVRAFSWLTLSGGVRLTHFGGSLSENAASPRLGASMRIPRLHWTLHGFYGRYYQAPPLATLSGPLLAFALDQGLGFLPLRGERDEERQFGLTIPVRGWALEANQFLTHARNYFDHNPLGNSNIFFPLTIEGARISGWEVLVRSPRLARRAQMHFAYSHQRAEGHGAVSGGLTDFEPPPDGRFFLDHDQRHTLTAGATLDLPHRVSLSTSAYYGSGFLDEEGPSHLPSHTTVDLVLGKQLGESWTIALTALNVANRRYLLDNSLTFGGIHFGEPRQVFVNVKYRFRL